MQGWNKMGKRESGKIKLGQKGAFRVSRQIWIPCSPKICFSKITSQLDNPADWDPFILHIWPLSIDSKQKKSAGWIWMDFAGGFFHCNVVIDQYQPYSHYSWFLTQHPRIRLSWRLTPENSGTSIEITIIREQLNYLTGMLWWKMRYERRLKRDAESMLYRLKGTLVKSCQDAS